MQDKDSESGEEEDPKENLKKAKGKVKNQNSNGARNSCIQTSNKQTPSIVGSIGEWLCVPENLPNHPTMVSSLVFLLWDDTRA